MSHQLLESIFYDHDISVSNSNRIKATPNTISDLMLHNIILRNFSNCLLFMCGYCRKGAATKTILSIFDLNKNEVSILPGNYINLSKKAPVISGYNLIPLIHQIFDCHILTLCACLSIISLSPVELSHRMIVYTICHPVFPLIYLSHLRIQGFLQRHYIIPEVSYHQFPI